MKRYASFAKSLISTVACLALGAGVAVGGEESKIPLPAPVPVQSQDTTNIGTVTFTSATKLHPGHHLPDSVKIEYSFLNLDHGHGASNLHVSVYAKDGAVLNSIQKSLPPGCTWGGAVKDSISIETPGQYRNVASFTAAQVGPRYNNLGPCKTHNP